MQASQGSLEAGVDFDGLVIMPLGGVGEFGMNLTLYCYKNKNIVVDAGIRFCEPRKLGASSSFPDLSEIFEKIGKPHSYIMTHGHEDHIGAIPYLLQRFPAPVYCTSWTTELILNKLSRLGMSRDTFSIHTVEKNDVLRFSDLSVQFVHVTHSIPMSCGLYFTCNEGTVYHSGDYKLDDDPVLEAPVDWAQFTQIGQKGLDLFLGDSTNSEAPGFCPGEKNTLASIQRAMSGWEGAVVCTTFSSNLWRIKIIIDAAIEVGRRVYIAGAGIELTLNIASKLNIFKMPDGVRISDEDLLTLPRSKIAILASGSQGETRSALHRMALGEFKAFILQKGDRVIFSSRIIPGNERQVIFVLDELRKREVEVLTPKHDPNLHVSGHAHSCDILKLINILNPKTYVPKHGGFSQLLEGRHLAENRGINTSLGQESLVCTGDILQLKSGITKVLGHIKVPLLFVESEGAKLISPENLRARLKIGELGLALVTGCYDFSKKFWLRDPCIDAIGVELSQVESDILTKRCHSKIREIFDDQSQLLKNPEQVFEQVRILVRRVLFELLNRKPVVLVKILLIPNN